MTPTRGFFSIIQFCPDLDRGEAANVGVVLAVPGDGFVDARFSDDNEGPKQRFGASSFDDVRLTIAKKALAARIRDEGMTWQTEEDLRRFGRREGNNLLVATPRTILAENAGVELEELFQRLVHVDARQRTRVHKPDLKQILEPKIFDAEIRRDLEIALPYLGKVKIPYAYKNGVLNCISSEGFAVDDKAAMSKAEELAVKGRLISMQSNESNETQRLIIVGGFGPSTSESVKDGIAYILDKHNSRLVREDDIDAFAAEIRRDAHK